MNVERLLAIKAKLEDISDDKFHMQYWLKTSAKMAEKNWCNTSGCIAGHAFMMFDSLTPEEALNKHHIVSGYCSHNIGDIFAIAKDLLDLTPEQAEELFTTMEENEEESTQCFINLNYITKQMAAEAIQNMVDTGKPKWKSVAIKHDVDYAETRI